MAKKYALSPSSARKFRELLGAAPASDSRETFAGAKFARTRPDPYAVQFAASIANGKYLVYIAEKKKLLYVNGKGVDLTKNLSQAEGDYPEEWYILPDAAQNGEVYLHVYTPKEEKDESCSSSCCFSPCDCTCGETDDVRVEFGDKNAHPRVDEKVVSILIAKTEHESETGIVKITQLVKSAIYMGGAGNFNTFDKGWYSTYKDVDGWHFKNCYYRIGEQGFTGEGGTVDRAGCWCLTVTKGKLYENKVEFFKDVAEALGELPNKYIIPLFVFEEDDDYCDCAPNRIHPVLDCRLGPYIGGIGSEDHGCFAIEGDTLKNCYFWNGSQLHQMDPLTLTDEMNGLILAISLQNGSQPTYEFYTSIGNLNASAASQDAVVIPLYKFGAGRTVDVDFRLMPRGDGWAVVA